MKFICATCIPGISNFDFVIVSNRKMYLPSPAKIYQSSACIFIQLSNKIQDLYNLQINHFKYHFKSFIKNKKVPFQVLWSLLHCRLLRLFDEKVKNSTLDIQTHKTHLQFVILELINVFLGFLILSVIVTIDHFSYM